MEAFLSRLEGVVNHGSYFTARCPAHDDKVASLSITKGTRRPVIFKCFSGCAYPTILDALGIDGGVSVDPGDDRFDEVREEIAYDYVDETGKLLYRTIRTLFPKGFRHEGAAGEPTIAPDTRRVLYRLPEVLQACKAGQLVYVVEGEKDADTLAALGLTATTVAGGAGTKWRPEWTESLEGGQVVVLPDNDPPGEAFARRVADSVPGSRIVQLPGLHHKGDVTDWLRAGHSRDELVRLTRPTSLLVLVGPELSADLGTEHLESVSVCPTPLKAWNDACRGRGRRGGLAPGWEIIIAGPAGQGKTKLALNVVDSALDAGVSTCFITLEMPIRDLVPRLYGIMAHRKGETLNLEPGPWYDAEHWRRAGRLFAERMDRTGAKFWISEPDTASLSGIMRAMEAGVRGGAGLVVIDYLQLISPEGTDGVYEATRTASRDLRMLTRHLNITTVLLSQYNRSALNSTEGGLSIHGMSGGAHIENDADQVLIIDPRSKKPTGPFEEESELTLGKNRHGPSGVKIKVRWNTKMHTVMEAPLNWRSGL
jgi:RecA/RadA recombinase